MKITGNDEGEMEISVTNLFSDIDVIKEFRNISVNDGKILRMEIEDISQPVTGLELFVEDSEGKTIFKVLDDGTEVQVQDLIFGKLWISIAVCGFVFVCLFVAGVAIYKTKGKSLDGKV